MSVASAKGAAFNIEPGTTSQGYMEWLTSALKARFTAKHRIWMNRAFSACLRGNQILGRPRLKVK